MSEHPAAHDPTRRIAELEAQLAEAHAREAELYARLGRLEASPVHPDTPGIFRALVDSASDGMCITDTSGAVIYANPAFRAASGFGEATAGRPIGDFYSPEDLARFTANVLPVVERMGRWEGLLQFQRADGAPWEAEATISAIHDSDGSPLARVSVLRDVTAERARTRRLRYLDALVQSVRDGVTIAGIDTRLDYVNPAFGALFGYSPEELRGMAVNELIPEAARAETPAFLSALLKNGTVTSRIVCLRKDRSTFNGQISAAVIYDADGAPQALAAILRDTSEEERAEQERMALQEQIIAAQQAALREVSTPLIPLASGVVAMPLVGAIDSARAQQIMETLLEGIAAQQADVAILDITGVRVVDTAVANALLRAAQAAKLLGARVMLTGIGAEVAQTLVGLGADMSQILTLRSLQEGIAFALGGQEAQPPGRPLR